MYLLTNNENIIMDAVKNPHYKGFIINPRVTFIDVTNESEATAIVDNKGIIHPFIESNVFGAENAVRVFGDYELPEDFEPNIFRFDPETTQIHPVFETPAERREYAYNTKKMIYWQEKLYTVTEASNLWQYYGSEGSNKTDELMALITTTKEKIREMYPD